MGIKKIVRQSKKRIWKTGHFSRAFYRLCLSCGAAETRRKIPLVVTEHSSLINRDTLPENIEKAAKTAFREADCLIAVSPALAKKMEEHSETPVIWIPDMVDTELFSYNEEQERKRICAENRKQEKKEEHFPF